MAVSIFKGWNGPDVQEQIGEPSWKPMNIEDITLKKLFFSNDYRMIGLKHILVSLIFFIVGGMAALLMRTELAAPGKTILEANQFYRLLTAHGATMVFMFIIPATLGIAYYMLPKLLKTNKLIWTGASHVSFWLTLIAGILAWVAFSDASWTFYPPLSLRVAGDRAPLFFIAVMLIALAEFISGAVFLANTLKNRAMPLKKMPLLGWAMLVDGIMLLLSVPGLFIVGFILLTDWMGVTALFDPARGGSSQLFMYLFWWYGHPAVYLPFLPAVGFVYTLLPRYLKRPMWSYGSGIVAFLLLTALGFVVFRHHFQPSSTTAGALENAFSIFTLLIIIPSSMHVFNWIATLWKGRPKGARTGTAFNFMIAAIAFMIYGGVVGFINAQIPLDESFVHDTYFVVGHFHAMFLGFVTQMTFSAIYYLYPYFTGRFINERLGNLHFWLWQIGIFTLTTMFYILGMLGMPRRVYDYLDTQTLFNLLATVGAFLVAAGMAVFIYNFIRSAKNGQKVTSDPYSDKSRGTSSGEVA
ncbi:cbb3-type cytochrome c oxidase subunit I [Microaerobacter geothermalis]|uniref:cytochrome c oxidase subunit I n=1 Tax=Microaerobacter geothermalis TaxID=674972 RepID=UPI001F4465C4|nr:cbb3-type cytochrome c oxidase subunit I [Microaerobacter geothermalis]MCF6094382.1 cbb3-type cytochrome c oxidase subunit I [Microaerobacter geothermalis]